MTITIADIERVGRETWSADERMDFDGWTVTSNGGFTRRVNSATSDGRPGVSIETKEAVSRWLAERGCPLVIRVTPLLDPATVEEITEAWGLVAVDPTVVMVHTALQEMSDPDVIVVDLLDQGFQDELFSLNARPDAARDQWSRIIARMSDRGRGLWIPGTAAGIVALDASIAAVYSVAVEPRARRRGWGTRIMEAAASTAIGLGAHTMFLQVLAANHPAVSLYQRLGFVEAYSYEYLVSGS